MDVRIVVHSEETTSHATVANRAPPTSASGRIGYIRPDHASSRVLSSAVGAKSSRGVLRRMFKRYTQGSLAGDGEDGNRGPGKRIHPTLKHKSSRSLRKFLTEHSKAPSASKADESRALVHLRAATKYAASLPAELWLLILRYAAYPPYVPFNSATPAYPHPFPYRTEYDPDVVPVSFLDLPTPHDHRHERRLAYREHLRRKHILAQVCRAWNSIAQEIIYEFVWISTARQGRALAEKLCGNDVDLIVPGAVVSVGTEGKKRRGWGRKQKTPDPQPVVHRKSSSRSLNPPSLGRFIKRLHVETAPLDQCSPHDLLLILQHCPNLDEFCDLRSVRRPAHPLVLSNSDVAPFSASLPRQPLLSPDALLHNLFSRPLKHLTWTNYDYDPANYAGGVRLYDDFLAPRLEAVGGSLEFFEIVLSSTSAFGMGGRTETGWSAGGSSSSAESQGEATLLRNPAVGMYGAANLLTTLEAKWTQTTTTVCSTTALLQCPPVNEPVATSIDGFTYTLSLPSLRSLKATLDNATFHVLARWDMPRLTNLCVLAADFSYSGAGFRRFFAVHGMKLTQLELGHSGADIEEAWITERPRRSPIPTNGNPSDHLHPHEHSTEGHGNPEITVEEEDDGYGPQDRYEGLRVPLESWCPNLTHFICSADAEWNWRSPDWIAPHVFLPAHPGVRFIGVRGLERRLVGDLDEALRRRAYDIGRRSPGHTGLHGEGNEWTELERTVEDAYFALLQQFGSVLNKEAFPNLKYVRDMSWESDIVRCSGRMTPLAHAASASRIMLFPDSPNHPYLHHPYHSQYSDSDTLSPSHSGLSPGLWRSAARRLAPSHFHHNSNTDADSRRTGSSQAGDDELTRALGRGVNSFWREVLRMCSESSVWLEDCRGVNVTVSGLRRAIAGAAR